MEWSCMTRCTHGAGCSAPKSVRGSHVAEDDQYDRDSWLCRQLFRSWCLRSKEPPRFRGAHGPRLRRGYRPRRPQTHRNAGRIPTGCWGCRGRWYGSRDQPWSGKLGLCQCIHLETQAVFKTGPRPNGVAVVSQRSLAIAACIGDEGQGAKLQVFGLDGSQHYSIGLPGPPRWRVTDTACERVFLAIREPSMVLVARLPDLRDVEHWKLPVGGAHGLDIDHQRGRLYVACDDSALVEVDIGSREVSNQWPIAGAPDVTFFNPETGLVYVAIGKPGLVQTIDPRTGHSAQFMTAAGAHTTALAAPNILYVFSPSHRGILVLEDA